MPKLALFVLLAFGLGTIVSNGEANAQVVKDRAGDARYGEAPSDIRRVAVTKTSNGEIRFGIRFRGSVKRRSYGTALIAIRTRRGTFTLFSGFEEVYKSKGKRIVETGEVSYEVKGKKETFVIPLRSLQNPRAFGWRVHSTDSEGHPTIDHAPNRGYRKFRVKGKGRAPLPVFKVPVTGKFGKIRLDCDTVGGCTGTISIERESIPLVEERNYLIGNGREKTIRLKLTRAGLKALQKSKRVRASGTLIGKSGAKLKIIAILKR